jgi:integrase
MPLTDRTIKNVKPDATNDTYLNDGRGLYLKVRPSGHKSWFYRYKVGTKSTWMALGHYPIMSLAEARAEALNAKENRSKGNDPLEQKRNSARASEEAKKVLNSRPTISKIYEVWFDNVIKHRSDEGKMVNAIYQKDVLPRIGDLKADLVTKSEIVEILDQILKRGSNRMCNMTLSLLKQFFSYSVVRGSIKTNPATDLNKDNFGGDETIRDRVLSEDEIRELHAKICKANMYHPSEYAIYIALSTSCRIGELIKAKWENIDLDKKVWLIPKTDAKNSRAHKIYLSDFAVTYFKKLQEIKINETWLYPNSKGDNHLETRSITKQIGDRQLDITRKPIAGRSRKTDALALPHGKWTPHDLRRTSATLMVSLGISPEVVERCLNHIEQNKLIRTYQVYDYAREQKEAWERLGGHLEKLMPSRD